MSRVCIISKFAMRGRDNKVALEMKFKRITVLPPIGKQKRYPPLDLTMIHASERGTPKGRKPIEWKLITDLPVRTRAEAIEKINWYAMRWKIEVLPQNPEVRLQGRRFKIAHSRTARQSDGDLLHPELARPLVDDAQPHAPEASPKIALTDTEIALLDELVSDTGNRRCRPGTLAFYLIKLARLGGYLARSSDPPPGNRRHLARPLAAYRYRTRRRNRSKNCG